ncbi:MAG: DegT/DnrJ/EryC1/StrS aminotransferase family protein [Actinobacteria bacterium]|nr:DegT/DnrJ/EryC1/StrS aminotransferase family protein [Actinomycetota bacterium]
MRQTFLPFAQPDLDGSEIERVVEVLRGGWLTTGPRTRELETQFAGFVGSRYAVAVNSCTAAMHLALEAVGVGPGTEVITSPYTFAATAAVIQHLGGAPVFADVLPDTLTIGPSGVEAVLSARTKAIVPIHLAGHPAEMEPLLSLAADRGLAVVEDSAHAFPTKYRDKLVGSFLGTPEQIGRVPSASCFSFYSTKTITTGEGGMICTDDEELADRCRLMSLHGMSRNAWARYTQHGSWFYEIEDAGFKCNMTDVAAAMGLAQLDKAERMHTRRTAIAEAYNEAFKSCSALEIPSVRPNVGHSWHLYQLRLNLERLSIDRDEFIQELGRMNIGTSVHFIPLHIHPYYRRTYGFRPEDFPVAHREYLREISLPIFSSMSEQDVSDVIEAVLEIVEGAEI